MTAAVEAAGNLWRKPVINHVSIGVHDVARSKKFYDAALKPLGYRRLSDGETSLGYGDKAVVLWVQKAERPVPADMASGLHFCFDAPSRKSVAEFHKAAMAAGGKDNGPAGLRADYGDNYYAGFVVDPDGYRLEAYCGQTK
jgi:catechol 2,3-dioxygenase-like lactoylglutathione lyase family enzyme